MSFRKWSWNCVNLVLDGTHRNHVEKRIHYIGRRTSTENPLTDPKWEDNTCQNGFERSEVKQCPLHFLPLRHWDCGFESLSRHGPMSAFLLCSCCPLQVESLRQAVPPSKEKHQISIQTSQKLEKREALDFFVCAALQGKAAFHFSFTCQHR
jgi:hypothetical protein